MNRARFLRLAAVAPWWLRHAAAGTARASDPRPAAIGWLLARQSDDGSWRSETYGAFRDGRALTPVVLRALAPHTAAAEACRRACRWMSSIGESMFAEYPVHLAAAVLESAPAFPGLQPLAVIARERLLDLQCPASGAWSYSPVPPAGGNHLPPMQQPNLAATAMAIDGLRAAGMPTGDPLLRRALGFIRACQNHGDGEHDDGGFFQMPGDPARNKAGSAGRDRFGKVRYRSYASATADGLRSLLHCGGPPDRIAAARRWLDRFHWSPRATPPDLIYCTARSLMKSGSGRADLPASLAAEQRADGSWRNPAGEMREDCPVVATALALEALE